MESGVLFSRKIGHHVRQVASDSRPVGLPVRSPGHRQDHLDTRFPDAAIYDLLDTGEALRLSKDPGALYRELAGLPAGAWAVVDEVQRVPELLNEAHRLIESRRLRFVLSGSSARKLRRRGVNLLAGRAVTTTMFPLVSAEVDFDLDLDRAFSEGTLPMALAGGSPRDYLRTYAQTYLARRCRRRR